jgi:polygalacturonase
VPARTLSLALVLFVGCGGANNPARVDAGGGGAGASSGGAGGGGTGGGGTGGGGSTGTGGGGGTAAADGGAVDSGPVPDAGVFSTSCDDIGTEPTIPTACATVLATKTSSNGTLTDESTLDTQAIQDAIDGCPAGQAVRLAPNGSMDSLLSGSITMRAGVTLWIDDGVILWGSRNPRDFDAVKSSGLCGGNNTGNGACSGLINATNVNNAALMGTGTIDGRGGEVTTTGTSTWWQLESADGGNLAAPRLVQVNGGQNFTVYKLNLRNAPKFHVVFSGTVGFTVWGINITTPANSPNTDGVDPGGSTNGVIAYSTISTGDDNVAIKGGGPLVVDNITVAHNHFGRGHGMSIGSETNAGVRNVRVCDLSLDGTSNGLRIKSDSSRGGLVQNVSYTDVCVRNVSSTLVFNPYYSSTTGTLIPNFNNIIVRNVHVLTDTKVLLRGYDATRPLVITLDNVVFDGALTSETYQDADLTLGPGPVGITPSGTDVMVTNLPSAAATPRDCTNAF